MAKSKSYYVCSECGYETVRWLGKCPECESWNTLTETLRVPEGAMSEKKLKRAPGADTIPVLINDIPDESLNRRMTGIGEFDRVLGGGVVDGSVMLVGGDPGIGKSTLLTQACASMSAHGAKVLYISGEESARQVKLRANRLLASASGFYVLAETDMNMIETRLEALEPDIIVVDSIQTMYLPEIASAPGSVSQVRESASKFIRFAKFTGASVFLIGHVTKDGAIAGPKILEHMVDAVLYFEGDANKHYRLLRAIKNRFGSVNELGMFEMTSTGMTEITNPSEALLSERAHDTSGSVVMCAIEGMRPLLTDVQALVVRTPFGTPRRMASGVDQGRLYLLLAVIEKRGGFKLYDQDVYLNIAGGMTLSEPASDLAVCAAVASALKNTPIGATWAVVGEVGLAGELRGVGQIERRINECLRMGFTDVVIPKANTRGLTLPEGVNAYAAETLSQAFAVLGLYNK